MRILRRLQRVVDPSPLSISSVGLSVSPSGVCVHFAYVHFLCILLWVRWELSVFPCICSFSVLCVILFLFMSFFLCDGGLHVLHLLHAFFFMSLFFVVVFLCIQFVAAVCANYNFYFILILYFFELFGA